MPGLLPVETARRALPLGLGGQPAAGPAAEAARVVPAHQDHRVVGPVEALAPLGVGRREARARARARPVARHRDLAPIEPVVREVDLVHRLLRGEPLLAAVVAPRLQPAQRHGVGELAVVRAHGEGAGAEQDHLRPRRAQEHDAVTRRGLGGGGRGGGRNVTNVAGAGRRRVEVGGQAHEGGEGEGTQGAHIDPRWVARRGRPCAVLGARARRACAADPAGPTWTNPDYTPAAMKSQRPWVLAHRDLVIRRPAHDQNGTEALKNPGARPVVLLAGREAHDAPSGRRRASGSPRPTDIEEGNSRWR